MTQPDPAPDARVSGARAPETALSPAPLSPAPAGPLSGLLVADFSRVLAGPYCTMLLADLGADVIKVESPGGDDTRQWMPPVTEDGRSTYYLAINRNKRSVALNLKDQGDLAAAQELARRADVFVQNFKPGGLARYGLDYDSVSATNPGVVWGSGPGNWYPTSLPNHSFVPVDFHEEFAKAVLNFEGLIVNLVVYLRKGLDSLTIESLSFIVLSFRFTDLSQCETVRHGRIKFQLKQDV